MLIGEYTHSIDDKKRLSLPSKFRKELGKTIIATRGLDTCLFLYSEKEWRTHSAKLAELSTGTAGSRGFNRFTLAGAAEISVDSVGRILIPDFLKRFARITAKVVLAGVGNRIELWDEKVWQSYMATIEKQADTLAEKLGEAGMI